MIEVEQLVAPVAEFPPCGLDLEDDAVVASQAGAIELQRALSEVESSFDEALRGDDGDSAWSAVLKQASEFLQVNKNLDVAVWLCQAAMRRHNLRGLSQSLAVIRRLCEQFWGDLHPRLKTAADRQTRVITLSGLGGKYFIVGLRNMRLVDRVPEATLKTCESAVTESGADEDTVARDFARTLLAVQPGYLDAEELDEAAQLADQALEHVRWISVRVAEAFVPETDVDCGDFLSDVDGKLIPKLESIRRILGHAVGVPVEGAAGAESAVAGAAAAQPAAAGAMSKERIRDLLDQMMDWYRKNEPSSPVPMLLDRAKRLMDRNFIDLLNDTVGDDAVRKAQQILGVSKED